MLTVHKSKGQFFKREGKWENIVGEKVNKRNQFTSGHMPSLVWNMSLFGELICDY